MRFGAYIMTSLVMMLFPEPSGAFNLSVTTRQQSIFNVNNTEKQQQNNTQVLKATN